MADISVRGYVSKPQAKTSSKGGFSSFTLSETIKDPKAPNGKRKAFYNVTDFNNEQPPEDGSFVKLEGWLKPREYESNGVKRMALDVVCQKLEVSPPRNRDTQAQPAAEQTGEEDPWGL